MKQGMIAKILRYLLIVSALIAFAYAVIWIILQGYSAAWTGFADFTKPNSDFVRGKTLWDWIQLFIIPLVGSVGIYLLNRADRESERRRAKENAILEQQRANERAKLEREIAIDRQQEAALQAYLDRMAELLLEKKLRVSENEELRNVAKIRTLTVLRGLGPRRKGLVLLFLYESGLIGQPPIISLAEADLDGAEVNGDGDEVNKVDLTGVNLVKARLDEAKLDGAVLTRAELTEAWAEGASLIEAVLDMADLVGTNLAGANLAGADLTGADLAGAYLLGANLTDANLAGANMTGVLLEEAVLTGAKVSDEQLLSVMSLRGATMPDGTKHHLPVSPKLKCH